MILKKKKKKNYLIVKDLSHVGTDSKDKGCFLIDQKKIVSGTVNILKEFWLFAMKPKIIEYKGV